MKGLFIIIFYGKIYYYVFRTLFLLLINSQAVEDKLIHICSKYLIFFIPSIFTIIYVMLRYSLVFISK
jgi:hypothetical protein